MVVRLFFDAFSGYFITTMPLDGKAFLAGGPVPCPCGFHPWARHKTDHVAHGHFGGRFYK